MPPDPPGAAPATSVPLTDATVASSPPTLTGTVTGADAPGVAERVGSRPRPRPAPAIEPAPAARTAAPEPAHVEAVPEPSLPPMRRGARRGRRVKRVVRRIELWSVLKVSLCFYLCLYAVTLVAGVLLWGFAHSAGLIDNFESFMQEVGFDDFRFYGDRLFRETAVIGAALAMAGAILTVLATALVNLISEVTGGIRFVVIEEDL